MPTFAAGDAGQKRRFALAVIDDLGESSTFPVAVYIIFTSMTARSSRCTTVLPSWSAGEDPLEDLG